MQAKGCPLIHKARDAVYHNWFSLFPWSQIVNTSKEVGWRIAHPQYITCFSRKILPFLQEFPKQLSIHGLTEAG
jgi:hypothetical protein